jgi:hypothetical protein
LNLLALNRISAGDHQQLGPQGLDLAVAGFQLLDVGVAKRAKKLFGEDTSKSQNHRLLAAVVR